MINLKSKKYQSGQAVLIVLLSLSVVLIIVLYVMSRSVTDISLSSKEEDSMRAFSAAEAGIERALVIGTAISSGTTSVGDGTFSASVSDFGLGENTLIYPLGLRSGETATFWFTRPAESGFAGSQARICWGTPGTSSSTALTPAIEATVFYNDAGLNKVARVVSDPYLSRTVSNSFNNSVTSLCTINGESFAFQEILDFPSLGITNYATPGTLQYVSVKLLYNSTVTHKVALDVSSTSSLLPSQGVKVNSDGSFASSNRSIEVYQLHPVAPTVFMNAVFSSTGITK